jgi:hypothetical protein
MFLLRLSTHSLAVLLPVADIIVDPPGDDIMMAGPTTPFGSADAARAFLYGGRAVATLKSRKSGDHITFKVAAPPKNPKGLLFVSVKTGSDCWRYVGMLDASRAFRTTTFTKLHLDAKAAAAFGYAAKGLADGAIQPDLEIWHEGRCGCCNRPLTVPSSLASGIGPECSKMRLTAR